MEDYDYIVIGAGSAGCVMAERLGADPRRRVLVLEAGGSDMRFWIKVPLGYAFTSTDARLNWDIRTAPDEGLNGRSQVWPRGRVVGGCSSINAMAYMRGLPGDFDDWGRAGAQGWTWDAVRATYDAIETHEDRDDRGRAHRRGTGPVWVSDLRRDMHPFSRQFLAAAEQSGWPVLDDLNAGRGEGLGYYRSSVRHGRRWSAADAFLRPALARGNVHLATHAMVQRIVIEDGEARGVAYDHAGQIRIARARRGVILSAGSVNSPQILQLSGIGPGALLQSLGIPVHNDLPQVGQGLQDHLTITYSFAAHPRTLNNTLGVTLWRLTSGMQYLATRRGPLSVPVNQVGGYLASTPGGPPDTQIFCNPIVYTPRPTGAPQVGRAPGYILSAQPCRPTSRGEIRIRSPRPSDRPDILPHSLSTDHDRAAAIRAGRLLQRLARSAALTSARREALGPDVMTMDDNALLRDFRDRSTTVYHPSCTCRMGDSPVNSVVDARLRVHGLGRLRGVDASAFPNITSGNTNAPTMMLAARAAQMIIEDDRR
ncbi:MAG: choline dehydrogenase [Rhodobacteraceae bacterium]|nr:choline dehydrogenase [Paracoccaceae bacterium]